ncbi:MAG: SAM-dependent DNA methyltransferase, partial [Oscillatoriales cyanobacterium]
MPVKKSELYSTLWKSCDELRGGMDASQYKDYVLVMLFVKYVSDRYAGSEDAPIYVPEGGGFADLVKLKGSKDIGEGMNEAIAALAEENDLDGVITVADFNNDEKLGKGKAKVDRLTNLIALFENPALDFSQNRADGDDLLGDAYEYLMRNFATESGKSKGQFYTPAEVSRVIAKLVGASRATSQEQTVYDPTCGSGSLLIRAADEAGLELSLYGQEMDNATRGLAKMNAILHGHPTAEIELGNTLAEPEFTDSETGKLKRFDFAVANPPFSSKAWMNGVDIENDPYDRFSGFGIPPAKNGDYAFLLHLVASLKSTGRGAIVLPHGVLFRGNAEADIRRKLVESGLIEAIVGLPPNLFYGTGIPACIVVIDKAGAADRAGIFIIDASRGFIKDGNKNRLRERDIHKIVDVFDRRLEVSKFSRFVLLSEIAGNEFNLNIPRYIDGQEPEDIQDLRAHLYGGLPGRDIEALSEFWAVLPSLKSVLFAPSDRAGYYELRVATADLKRTIFEHSEFVAFADRFKATLAGWRDRYRSKLAEIERGVMPGVLAMELADDLLERFEALPLVDGYAVFQHFMDYWLEVMRDDVYLISQGGWVAELSPVLGTGKKVSQTIGYRCELIPVGLMEARFFAAERAAIGSLEAEVEGLGRELEELAEEHGGDEGLLSEVVSDSGKLTKGAVTARLKVLKKMGAVRLDEEDLAERSLLERVEDVLGREGSLKQRLKLEVAALEGAVLAKYGVLSGDVVRSLVIEDKWFVEVDRRVRSELDRVSQFLAGRVLVLSERYGVTLGELED